MSQPDVTIKAEALRRTQLAMRYGGSCARSRDSCEELVWWVPSLSHLNCQEIKISPINTTGPRLR